MSAHVHNPLLGPPEIHFYHILIQPMVGPLVFLLEKMRQKGWPVVIQVQDFEDISPLSDSLWSFREDSFLAHGTPEEGDGPLQPIWITCEAENPNGALARVFWNGGDINQKEGVERILYLFSGDHLEHIEAARTQWRKLAGGENLLLYWKQKEDGSWLQSARSKPNITP